MRRLVDIVAVTLLLLCALEIVASRVESGLPPATMWYTPRAELVHEYLNSEAFLSESPQVVLMGSSMMGLGGLSETLGEQWGTEVANVSLPGADMTVSTRFLTEEVLTRSSPKMVVLGVASFDFNANHGNPSGLRYESQLATRPGVTAGIERGVGQRLALVRNRMFWGDPVGLIRELRSTDAEPPTYDIDWHQAGPPRYAGQFAEHASLLEVGVLKDFVIDDTEIVRLGGLIETLQADNIRVVIVALPVTTEYVAAHPRGREDFEAATELIRQEAKRRGAEYLDLSRSMPRRSFYDNVHLNRDGAIAFTEMLGSLIHP